MSEFTDSMIHDIIASNGPDIAVQMMPFDNENAAALGGPPPSGVDRVASTVFYKSLNRMATLPLPPRYEKIKDEQLKDAYFRMCGGDFVAQFSIGHNEVGETLTLEAGFYGEKLAFKMHLFGTPEMYGKLHSHMYHDSIFYSLPQEVYNILIWRTLHVFIRNMGAQLPWRIVELAQYLLVGRYGHKYFEEALDISLVKTDVGINTDASLESLFHGIFCVSCALLALDRPLDAALATEELAEMFFKSQGGMHYMKLAMESASAFENDGTYDRSYEAYIKALSANMKYQGEGSFDLNEEHFHGAVECFIDMLCQWCSRETSQEREDLLIVFSALLVSAGYIPVPRQSTHVSSIYCEALKDVYKRKEKAKKAIRRSLTDSNVETFRAVILGCKNARRRMNLHVKNGTGSKPSRIDTPIDTKRNMKNAQETLLALGGGRPKWLPRCGNPDCQTDSMSQDLLMCPCKQVYYCQEDCQKSHWKVHKQTCTVQKKKKQNQSL